MKYLQMLHVIYHKDVYKRQANNITEDELLKIAASAEKSSEHPLGEAIVRKCEEKNLGFYKVDKFMAIPGYGIEVIIENKDVLLGNIKLMKDKSIDIENLDIESDKLACEGKTPMYICLLYTSQEKQLNII